MPKQKHIIGAQHHGEHHIWSAMLLGMLGAVLDRTFLFIARPLSAPQSLQRSLLMQLQQHPVLQ